MAKQRKSVEEMSADELYELAKRRETEEEARQREALRADLESKRAKRRELVARQKKELAEVDKEIRKLQRKMRGGGAGGGRRGGQLSKKVEEVIGRLGKASTKDIRAKLEAEGVDTGNLGQTLAYLKRNGRVKSPQRAVYTLAK
ncbi:MAG TPA: hypothetical protein VKA64_11455 [Gammaproteobacteria bacterium]|nr:hypothetical protein [Gammaproteobacteria bacterium]